VLTRDYNAMFARGDRWQGGRRIGRSVYLVVDDLGHLSISGGMFEPTYADAVDDDPEGLRPGSSDQIRPIELVLRDPGRLKSVR
jgi:hypothetical protein